MTRFFPIETLLRNAELTGREVRSAAVALLDEAVPLEEKAAFLRALAAKGETAGEIAAFVEAFLEHAVDPGFDPASAAGPLIDVCGTGGDQLHLFNVSTTAIFILAAAGAVVVKHGNRGITSRSGGADVLEALGVRIDLPPDRFRECVRRTGLGFLFAPSYHPAFRAVAPVRKALAGEGVRTVFNLIGPLLNPVRPAHQLIGVFAPGLPPVFAEILRRLGRKRAWAVHGTTTDGAAMDELSTLGPNLICRVEGDAAPVCETVLPGDLGFAASGAGLADLQGGDAGANARILRNILEGTDRGPKRDLALLNAGAALVVAGLAPDLVTGIGLAGEQIDRGAAREKLDALREATG